MDSVESQLYGMAQNGNGRAAEALLLLRKDKTGECFFEIFVTNTVEAPPAKPIRRVKSLEPMELPPGRDFDIDVDTTGQVR
jgi:hypothetical protein